MYQIYKLLTDEKRERHPQDTDRKKPEFEIRAILCASLVQRASNRHLQDKPGRNRI